MDTSSGSSEAVTAQQALNLAAKNFTRIQQLSEQAGIDPAVITALAARLSAIENEQFLILE